MLRVSGRNLDIGEALRGRIEQRVVGAVRRFFDGGFEGHVSVGREGAGFRTECAIHLDSGIVLTASDSAHDAYESSDGAAAHLEKRLRRYKSRLTARPEGNGVQGPPARYTVFEAPPEAPEEPQGTAPVIVAETTKAIKSLSVSNAVAELDLTGTPFLVFRHAGHGRVNVVYRRSDGNIGWIDPPPSEARG